MSEEIDKSRETLRALAEAARDETQWFHPDDTYSALLFLGNTETAVTLERAELVAACSPDVVLGLLDALAEAERERDAMATTARELEDAAEREDELRRRLSKAEAVVERQARAVNMAMSRLALARASMRAALKHNEIQQVEAWLLAAEENEWFAEIEALAEPQEQEQDGRSGL